MIEVVINDLVFDVSPDTVFAQTINGIDLSEPTKTRASYTNELKLPKTKRNLSNIDLLHLIGSQSNYGYRKYVTRVLYNGVPIISNGFSIFNGITDKINVVVYSDEVDFFNLVGDALLSEMTFSSNFYGSSVITWNLSSIDTNRKRSSNYYLAPVIQYGNINEATGGFTMPQYSPPSVWVETILNSIIYDNGYTPSGGLFNSSVYQSIILPYSRKDFPSTSISSCAQVLPDIKQKDFIRDIISLFGCVFRIRNGVFQTQFLSTILSDLTNAIDWTAKRDASREDLSFDTSGFAKTNWLKYQSNDDFFNEDVDSVGSFTIDNDLIDKDADFYRSIFNGSMIYNMTNTVPQIIETIKVPIWDSVPSSWDFDNDPGVRIARAVDDTNVPVSYNGNSRTDYLVGKFNDLDLQDMVDTRLTELKAAVQRFKKVRRYYNLSLMDITTLDTWKLIYDEGHYFIINSIQKYIPGQLTGVDLTKIL